MITLDPVKPDDIATLTAVQRAFDTAWFGEPENDTDEIREWLALARAACVVRQDGRPVGMGRIHRTGSDVLVDPRADAPVAYRALVRWLQEGGAPETESLDRDEPLRAALTEAGWRHSGSSFDLLRPVSPGQDMAAPQWPSGVQVRSFSSEDAAAVHRLVYVDAGWADVPGHFARDLEEWRQIFLPARETDPAPVVAWQDDRPVGAALPRLYSDGTGWVGQLAVASDARGRGLGRALLLAAFARLTAAGATKLGLSVIATNRAALRLYLGVGLQVDREWQTFVPPVPAGS